MTELLDSLSPLERKVIPFIDHSLEDIKKKTNLDETSVMRALKFLENKKILAIVLEKKKIVDIGVNGAYYRKNHLPERTLLMFIEKNAKCAIEDAQKRAGLSENEFKAALGVLKRKALVELTNGKISLIGSREEITKKFIEEKLLEILPKEQEALTPEEAFALEKLKERKDMIDIREEKRIMLKPTELGKSVMHQKSDQVLIEEITSDLIKSTIKQMKFRRYDIHAAVPKLQGGKTHFVNQARDYARRIWLDMGFKEMEGPVIDSAFWVFDALFTAQDHPVREMQDSFYIKGPEAELPSKELVQRVKKAHEKGVAGSKGWNYIWKEEEAKRFVMRTHTTSLSARTLASLKEKDLPAKYFSVEKAFRNETIDWSHGIEFYQTDGIVVGKELTFLHLLGYLKEFYKKMRFEEIRFRPSFFPYTEPSVEIDVFHKERGIWLELGGAGIFRPEVTEPLFGKSIPVLAWGQGLDRMIMDACEIKDLREVYANNIKMLRMRKAGFF